MNIYPWFHLKAPNFPPFPVAMIEPALDSAALGNAKQVKHRQPHDSLVLLKLLFFIIL